MHVIERLAQVARETSGVSVTINITQEGYKIHFMNTYLKPVEGDNIEDLCMIAKDFIVNNRREKTPVVQTHTMKPEVIDRKGSEETNENEQT